MYWKVIANLSCTCSYDMCRLLIVQGNELGVTQIRRGFCDMICRGQLRMEKNSFTDFCVSVRISDVLEIVKIKIDQSKKKKI